MAIGAGVALEINYYHDIRLEPGDMLLMCSDGLHGVVEEQRIVAILRGGARGPAAGREVPRADRSRARRRAVRTILRRCCCGPRRIGVSPVRCAARPPDRVSYEGILSRGRWLLALPCVAMAQIAVLQIKVLEGEGAVHPPGARIARPSTVEVTDETGQPVAGAAVSFQLPPEGPSGLFSNGLRTDLVLTDAAGRASIHSVQLNRTGGQFRIRITAVKEQARAGAVSTQYIGENRNAELPACRNQAGRTRSRPGEYGPAQTCASRENTPPARSGQHGVRSGEITPTTTKMGVGQPQEMDHSGGHSRRRRRRGVSGRKPRQSGSSKSTVSSQRGQHRYAHHHDREPMIRPTAIDSCCWRRRLCASAQVTLSTVQGGVATPAGGVYAFGSVGLGSVATSIFS